MSFAPDPYLPERGDTRYEARRYELDLAYTPGSNRLEGTATIDIAPRADLDAVVLDLAGLRVRAAQVDGTSVRWRHRGTKLRLELPERLRPDESHRVSIRYEGNPRSVSSPWGPVGWEQLTDGVLVAAQPSGACTWFPCNDVAAQKATFTVHVSVPAPYVAVVNGAGRGGRRSASRTTWTYDQPEPTSPYLMSLHVGRYQVEHLEGPVPVRLVAPGEHLPAARRAFAQQAAMLDAFTERFGPYPLDAGLTVVVCGEPLDIPLEAQGQSIFGTNHLDGRHERLVAHELAHQWFGNSLTAARWRDIWLHEGFACYAEWLWSEAAGKQPADHHARTYHGRLAGLPQDLVLADPGPAAMFDDRVYKRGALALHAVRLELGDDAFAPFLRSWVAEHRHGLVTTGGFEDAVAGVAGRRLDGLFDAWLREPALPPLSAG